MVCVRLVSNISNTNELFHEEYISTLAFRVGVLEKGQGQRTEESFRKVSNNPSKCGVVTG